MGKTENDTRKATIDLENFLTRDPIPPLHVITKAFYLRYGFTKRKLKTILNDCYPAFYIDEESDSIKKIRGFENELS